jgi:phosphoribosylformylglycinamidine cyclo-ligase
MSEQTTYLSAGVNIDEAQRALRSVSREVQSTYKEGVLGGIGGFGSLVRASFPNLTDPVLVSSIDGVGTKTKVAAMVGKFDGLGFDIVHHCTNDILCQGAAPLFFLDYFGTSRLSGLTFETILRSMAQACQGVGASLVGGETAEMPGVYHDDEIDLVGTIVGVVDYEKRYPRQKSRPGDLLIGLASDGLHTNGYSLARRVFFELRNMSCRDHLDGFELPIGEELLRPHRCYFDSVYPLLQESDAVHALAHITGGGLYDNIPRVLSTDSQAVIERQAWVVPDIFRVIQAMGNVADSDMFRTFNMGIGMVLIVDRDAAPSIVSRLKEAGESATVIGEITSGSAEVTII